MPPLDRLTTAATFRTRARNLSILCIVFVISGLTAWRALRSSPEQLARAARLSAYRGDTAKADRLLDTALYRAPTSAEVLVAAGELAALRGDVAMALRYYDRVPDGGGQHTIVGVGAAGDLLLQSHRFSEAERRFRRILAVDPQHLTANRRLGALLVMGGRRRESAPYLFNLVRLGQYDVDELALLGNLNLVFDDEELIERYREAAPDEPMPQLAAARIALQTNQTSKAAALLKPLVARFPELWEARINLGKVLVELGTDEEFLDWHCQVPHDIDENPDLWVIRGQFAERRDEPEVAIRCYWEALRRDPDVWQANYQLAWLLEARSDARAAMFLERSKTLKSLSEALKKMLLRGATFDLTVMAAELTESLGRAWEAWAWYKAAAKLEPESVFAEVERKRIEQQLNEGTPRTNPSANPALTVDFSALALPQWKSAASGHKPLAGPVAFPGKVRFVDLAQAAGIRFTYYNGDDPAVPGMRTWQSFGGGVAVLDVDNDGWPDLFFTQGGDLPAQPGETQPSDRLYRNRGDGRFADVTESALLVDSDYGQGTAAGDYDNDGFCDLYVANIGRNRLFHNNGDGTFSDVTDVVGMSKNSWTASCLVADLNADGLPDIYDVTYLAGRRPFEEFCNDPEIQENRICSPTLFDAEEDRLYLNLGDGTFSDVAANAGIWAPDGKGLGAVVADFELTGRLNIFVANDTTSNFYFVNETASPGGPPRFSERAVAAGCAYNSAGKSQACMGIAVADADGDGLPDLYVTNIFNEYNVLYLQRPGGLFIDGTSGAGLKLPSEGMTGFGTQFIDANLDGWPDLVVANGHVDDYTKRHISIPYRMRPQFYANLGTGRFAELAPHELGDYFERRRLGRGLARLDWNRDGREDFAVSHLDSPAALVTNQSPQTGHFLALTLRGVRSSRDAVGAVVRVTAAGRTQMQQITAGDGYYASNQKQLIFGLAEADSIDELQIRWPSGLEQEFAGVAADCEFLLVEGRRQLHRLPSP